MEENMSQQELLKCLPKLPTGIRGFDKVFYGGIDLNAMPLVIIIRGSEDDKDKCMLAMQMLYGIAQAIERSKTNYPAFQNGWNNEPIMYSTYYQKNQLDDLFLDHFISSSIQEILRKKASKTTSVSLGSNIFSNLLFDCSRILCQGINNGDLEL